MSADSIDKPITGSRKDGAFDPIDKIAFRAKYKDVGLNGFELVLQPYRSPQAIESMTALVLTFPILWKKDADLGEIKVSCIPWPGLTVGQFNSIVEYFFAKATVKLPDRVALVWRDPLLSGRHPQYSVALSSSPLQAFSNRDIGLAEASSIVDSTV